MIDIENIKRFSHSRVDAITPFGTAAEFDSLPQTHRDQIFFIDKQYSEYVHELLHAGRLITGGLWDPFAKGNFKTVEIFDKFWGSDESWQLLKKWLYHRGIAFTNWVIVLTYDDYPILTTWKMVIKYSRDLFIIDDTVVFDQTFNWCLVKFHEGTMFFGKDNIYDPTEENKIMEQLNERKKKYPQFKHPFMDPD